MMQVYTFNPYSLYFIFISFGLILFYIFLENMQFCNVILLDIIPSSPINIIFFLFVCFAITIIQYYLECSWR